MVDANKLRSFIQVTANSHFPIQNLPYGVFKPTRRDDLRIGTAIGEFVLDLSVIEEEGFFNNTSITGRHIFSRASLNKFMSLGRSVWKEVRSVIQELLDEDNPTLRDNELLRDKCLIPLSKVHLSLPVKIGGYTDFYSSKEHATNMGIMFRGKEKALLENWVHLPVAYHGRISSIVISGTDVNRPSGQMKSDKEKKTQIWSEQGA